LDETRHRIAAEIKAAHPDIAEVKYYLDNRVVFTDYIEDAHPEAKPLPQRPLPRYYDVGEPILEIVWFEADRQIEGQYRAALKKEFQGYGGWFDSSYDAKKNICGFESMGKRAFRDDFPTEIYRLISCTLFWTVAQEKPPPVIR
jgi:hypothetical protein